MNFVMKCSTEELALLVSLTGYPNVAKGILETGLGRKTQQEWDAVMEATAHQLMVKDLWVEVAERNGDIPLSEEMQMFIKSYVESNYMIRIPDAPNQHAAMLHHIQGDTWLLHSIDRDIIHEFAYMTVDEMPQMIKDYYAISEKQPDEQRTFALSDETFDLLSVRDNVKKVQMLADLAPEEEIHFQAFLTDLDHHAWTLHNISFFHIPSIDKDPLLENITFFLPGSEGVWVVSYQDGEELPVRVTLESTEEWNAMAEGVAVVARQISE
ncbi:hypothetical protein PQ478_02520 [Alkalihalophilus pseudofirmus]|uniref:hypothetical protein n=1 Tax=Alkalihalophilus pseudofirmus TaxID=79885 RepID=UPI00259BA72B|nr:hypothetical protein [Alkalihalophilus pseudofirmus]WEG17399.1 hypothetical protein PQ478_02520 [Alkalihalophilus pseudofirmus]